MKDKLVKFIKTKPVFILLLPVFFVLHGFTEYFNFIPVKDAALLTLLYIVASLVLGLLFWFLFRNLTKAALAAFAIMAFNFFFGSGHDFLKNVFGNIFIVRYTFILPVTVILGTAFIIYLNKTKRYFTRTTQFLNSLFFLLIAIDVGTLLFKIREEPRLQVAQLSKTFIACDTCSRHDIYLIIADEYAGNTQLKDNLSFDNSDFENQLKSRGFYIVSKSRANYNFTVYSMASLLNMDYIKNLDRDTINQFDILSCQKLIKNSNLINFLKIYGYELYNFSFFKLNEKPNAVSNRYFNYKTELIVAQTFIHRFDYNLGFHYASQEKLISIAKHNLYNDKKVDSLTRNIVLQKTTKPKFIYTHLNMPHHSYYFDSTGKEIIYDSLSEDHRFNKKAYIDYLIYTNKKLLELVDHIRTASNRPPIIILMGDHGFRQFSEKMDKKYYFMNLNAVYFPSGNYKSFYEGMSNVNQFRIVLNTEFGQRLPLLKDSSSFFKE